MGAGAGAAPAAATGGGTAKTVEQIVRETEGPNLDAITVAASASPPVMTADGATDFSAIYRQANLPAAPFTAEQMLEMLASLPQELPLDTKRQTVKVTLGAMGKAIGATPETIVADASRKLAALPPARKMFPSRQRISSPPRSSRSKLWRRRSRRSAGGSRPAGR